MLWEAINGVVLLATLLVLVWQTRALRLQISRGDIQSVYNRYLELTKLEVDHVALHRMFMYPDHIDELTHLSDEQLRDRALALLILDQFAMLFNMSGPSWVQQRIRLIVRRVPALQKKSVLHFLDRRKSVWEINADYIENVLRNPMLMRAWCDWRLGETWEGSQFHDYVSDVIGGCGGSATRMGAA